MYEHLSRCVQVTFLTCLTLAATGCGGDDLTAASTPPVQTLTVTATHTVTADATSTGAASVADRAPRATPPATAPTQPPVPLAQGSYSGTFTVLEDSSRHPEADEASSFVGEVFERQVTLQDDCDASPDACTIVHESFALYFAQDLDFTWTLERLPSRWSASYEEGWVDDCVDEEENVVGTFDTDVRYEMTLMDPEMVQGALRWTTMEVRYVEDATSDDTDQGCYTSRYVAEGVLQRSSH